MQIEVLEHIGALPYESFSTAAGFRSLSASEKPLYTLEATDPLLILTL